MERTNPPFDEKATAKYLGISVRTLQGRRRRREPPAYHKIGGAVRYFVEDLEAYLASCRVEPEVQPRRRGQRTASANL